MSKLKTLDLFSGIGGFSLGLERTGGFETVAFCEIDPFCRRVLAKHWPDVRQYDDVRTLTADTLARDGIAVDVICGGFPCQDISICQGAGRRGMDGERSGLWSEYARLIGELRPQFVIVENVSGLLSLGVERVLGDLAAFGFDAEWHCIPAGTVGAPHIRDRLWLVGHSNDESQPDVAEYDEASRLSSMASNAHRSRLEVFLNGQEGERPSIVGTHGWTAEPDVGRVAYGVSQRVDRLTALGNAVVPQIPELIGRAILASREIRDVTARSLPGALPAEALASLAERLDAELLPDGRVAGDGFEVLFDTTLRGGFAVSCDEGWDWLECRAWIRSRCGFDEVEETPVFMAAAAEAREISKRYWAPGGWADRKYPVLPMTAWRVIDPDGNDGAVTEHRERAASRIAGKLLRTRSIEPQLAFDILVAWNQTWCRPPLPDDDIRGIFDAIAIREIERLELADE